MFTVQYSYVVMLLLVSIKMLNSISTWTVVLLNLCLNELYAYFVLGHFGSELTLSVLTFLYSCSLCSVFLLASVKTLINI